MNTEKPIDPTQLARLGPLLKDELRRMALAGAVSPHAALKVMFNTLYGENRSREDRWRFLLFAAPLARRIAIELVPRSDKIGYKDVRVSDLDEWLLWLDIFDPLCARMIDLHYFAGLSTKETAQALGRPTQSVVRDLRFAKAWLTAKLR